MHVRSWIQSVLHKKHVGFVLFSLFLFLASGPIQIRVGPCFSSPCGAQFDDSNYVTQSAGDHFLTGNVRTVIAPTAVFIAPTLSLFGFATDAEHGGNPFWGRGMKMGFFSPLFLSSIEADAVEEEVAEVEDLRSYLRVSDSRAMPVMYLLSQGIIVLSVFWWYWLYKGWRYLRLQGSGGRVVASLLVLWLAMSSLWVWFEVNMDGYFGVTFDYFVEQIF